MKFLNQIDGADKVIEDSLHRFATDAEKATWNSKQNSLGTGTTVQYLRGDGAWVTPPNTNTTYTAGSGIGLSGTAFSVAGGNGLVQETSGLALGTPSTVTNATTNSLTATSHTHALTLVKADITALGIPAQDTVYTHPTNHPPSIITQDASNRFVTDAEKATWNAKGSSNLALGTTSVTAYRGDYGNTAYTHSQVAHAPSNANYYVHPTGAGNNHIPTGGAAGQFLKYSASGTAVWAADNNTVYTHPSTHPATVIVQTSTYRFVTDVEKAKWNSMITVSDDIPDYANIIVG